MAGSVAEACFHCGLPVPTGSAWRVAIDGAERSMCCPGCEAVARAIVDSGLDDYYRNRQSLPQGVADAVPDALKLYDTPKLADRFTAADGGGETTLCFGVHLAKGDIGVSLAGLLIDRREGATRSAPLGPEIDQGDSFFRHGGLEVSLGEVDGGRLRGRGSVAGHRTVSPK